MKRILVLGAGLVAKPLVEDLLGRGYQVHVATHPDRLERARLMAAGHANGSAGPLDLRDEAKLDEHVKQCDLAVSLVPYMFHPLVAKHCVANRKDMVTTSYVSDAMKELDEPARRAGVSLLNEMGVDPGIDHMSAMRVIDGARQKGGRVVAFRSYCGGLPAPEDNDNPFGYKFSWAPRGVLLAGRNSAEYLLDGRRVTIPASRLFRDMHILSVDGVGDFEAYPNRDSISYIDICGLHGIRTMFRGTLRNMGWCDTLYNFGRLGLLELEEVEAKGKTYADLMRGLIGCGPKDDLASAAAKRLTIPIDSLPIANLRWLGLLSDRVLPFDRVSPLDALASLMLEKLEFGPRQRDLLLMFHEFQVEYPDGRGERVTASLVVYGIPGGDSAMSRTVSLPAAIGAHLILTGKLNAKGVLRPVIPEIYRPVLDELEGRFNIRFEERAQIH